MPPTDLLPEELASAAVAEVFADIRATRQTDYINNFWRAMAPHPDLLRRTWFSIKEVMRPGEIDALTKELLYLAVSISNQCEYCITSHKVAAIRAGMSEAAFGELLSVVGMANETNRLVSGLRVPIDERFLSPAAGFPPHANAAQLATALSAALAAFAAQDAAPLAALLPAGHPGLARLQALLSANPALTNCTWQEEGRLLSGHQATLRGALLSADSATRLPVLVWFRAAEGRLAECELLASL